MQRLAAELQFFVQDDRKRFQKFFNRARPQLKAMICFVLYKGEKLHRAELRKNLYDCAEYACSMLADVTTTGTSNVRLKTVHVCINIL